MRIDVNGVMRWVDSFPELWRDQQEIQLSGIGKVRVIGLADLNSLQDAIINHIIENRYLGLEYSGAVRAKMPCQRPPHPHKFDFSRIKPSQFMTVILFRNCRLFCLSPKTQAGIPGLPSMKRFNHPSFSLEMF